MRARLARRYSPQLTSGNANFTLRPSPERCNLLHTPLTLSLEAAKLIEPQYLGSLADSGVWNRKC